MTLFLMALAFVAGGVASYFYRDRVDAVVSAAAALGVSAVVNFESVKDTLSGLFGG